MRKSFSAALAMSLLLGATSAEAVAVRRGGAVVPAAARPPVPGRVLVVDDGQLELDASGRLSARAAPVAALLARHGLVRGWALCKGRSPGMSRFMALASTRPDFDPVSAPRWILEPPK